MSENLKNSPSEWEFRRHPTLIRQVRERGDLRGVSLQTQRISPWGGAPWRYQAAPETYTPRKTDFLKGCPEAPRRSQLRRSRCSTYNLQQCCAFAARQHATRTAATARLAQPSPVPFYSPRKSCDHARDSACCPPHDGTSAASVAVQRGRCCMRCGISLQHAGKLSRAL